MSNDAARDVLRGFGHRNTDALERLANFSDWQRVAGQELERRATAIVQSLDEDTLRAIASGQLDFTALCRRVAAELSSAKAA